MRGDREDNRDHTIKTRARKLGITKKGYPLIRILNIMIYIMKEWSRVAIVERELSKRYW